MKQKTDFRDFLSQCINLILAVKLCNLAFTREAVVSNVIASCRDSLVTGGLLVESDHSDPSCGNIFAHNQSDKTLPFLHSN